MHFVLDLDIQNVDLPAERKEKKDLPAVDKTGEGDYKITLPFLGGSQKKTTTKVPMQMYEQHVPHRGRGNNLIDTDKFSSGETTGIHTLDVSGIIEKFNVYVSDRPIIRTVFFKTLSFLLLGRRISVLYHVS